MTACVRAFTAAAVTAACLTPAFQPPAFHGEPPAVLTEAEVLAVVRAAGLPDVFVDIAYCESGFNPRAVGKNRRKDGTVWSTDVGLWQINSYWWGGGKPGSSPAPGWDRRFTPDGNARLAARIYDMPGGLDHWVVWKHRNTPGSWAKKCMDGRPN